MRDAVLKLWPEIEWIQDASLREQVTKTWETGAGAQPADGRRPESHSVHAAGPNCPTTFMEHKRCVVHIARKAAESMTEFMGNALPIDRDTVIAGAILADVGKLLEYERADGKTRQSKRGECCAIRLPACRWRWSAEYPMRSATSSRPTQPKATS